jgi:hypothetical protein
VLRFKRPSEPPSFQTAVADARDNLAKKGGKGLTEKDFPSLWSEFKALFTDAQYGKCGYCESSVTGTQHGDVEHYRPKGSLQELPWDRARLGKEKPNSTSVDGRKLDPLCDEGYWWIAYEWSNYLLACAACNQVWKKCLFPIAEAPRCVPPMQGVHETPLLLNPFEGPDPADHLRFDKLGAIEPRDDSRFGRATIDTCGLDRLSLQGWRGPVAQEAARLAESLIVAEGHAHLGVRTGWSEEEILDKIRSLGDARRPYAGMVRIIVQEITDLSWDDITALS